MVYPALPLRSVRIIDIDAAAGAAIPGYDLVGAVGVQVGGQDRMTLGQPVVDHLPLPLALVVQPVNGNLVAVPGLDCRQKSRLLRPASEPPHRDIARSRFRPWRRIALR